MTLNQAHINYVNKVNTQWCLIKWYKKNHKHLLATINKKKDKNKYSHEMTRFWNRIAVWSSLHNPVLTYGSSRGSVFKSSWYRVQNGYKSESLVIKFGSNERVWNAVTRNRTHREKGESTHTQNTLTHVPIHAHHMCIHTQVIHIHTFTHHGYSHVYMQMTHACTHK